MYDLLHLSNNPQPDPEEIVRRRVKAKVEFWQFLDETLPDLLKAYDDTMQLTEEILSAAIWTLHPHYEGGELIEECRCILVALKIPVPENYLSLFTDTFSRIVLKKIIANERNMRK